MKRLRLASLAVIASIVQPISSRATARDALDAWLLHSAQQAAEIDDAQSRRLRDDLARYRSTVDALRERFRAQMKTLDGKVKSMASDADVQASLDALLSTAKAIAAERQKLVDQTAAYLTPTQRAKIALDLAGHRLRRTP